MGNSQASEERKKSKAIEGRLMSSAKADQKIVRALALGMKDSGKSAFMKQARQLYGQPYTAQELAAWREPVHIEIVSQVLALVHGAHTKKFKLDVDLCAPFLKEGFTRTTQLTSGMAHDIRELWEDAMQRLDWQERSRCQVKDNFEYFVEHIDRIAAARYVPTYEDILQIEDENSGVDEVTFFMDGVQCVLYSIGRMGRDQRSLRRYLGSFDGKIRLVTYFVATNEYDQYSSEREEQWKVDESLELFERIVTNELLGDDTGIFLVMNKTDLFRRKLRDVPYRVAQGSHQRNLDFIEPEVVDVNVDLMNTNELFEAAIEHMTQRFQNVTSRDVYVHTSNGDTDMFQQFYGACTTVSLKNVLGTSGFAVDS